MLLCKLLWRFYQVNPTSCFFQCMYIFQDDNTKIHQNQIVKDWPPQSPDLNPIEKPLGCARVEFTLPVQKRLNTLKLFQLTAFSFDYIVHSLWHYHARLQHLLPLRVVSIFGRDLILTMGESNCKVASSTSQRPLNWIHNAVANSYK